LIKVKIVYLGKYERRACKKEESILVEADMESAAIQIKSFLLDKYGFKPPYSILINQQHLISAVKNKDPLKEGDSFRLIPLLSGG
jgi:molybdopterin converting factor small subunit